MSEIKILVADDEEIIQSLLAKIFENDGYEVTAVYDGNEAFRKIQQESFDLVVTDINMPGRNGIEILKAVKGNNPDTEVLLITGYASLETAIEAVRNGAYDYIEKPFDIKDLRKIVARALEKHRLVLEKQALMEQLKKRVFELDVLYNVSNTISYTLDFKQLVSLIMAPINKVVEYDVSCSLLSTEQGIDLMVQRVKPITADFIDAVKTNIVSAFNALVRNPISASEISIAEVTIQPLVELNFEVPLTKPYLCMPNHENSEKASQKKLDDDRPALVQSFFNVPLTIQDEVVGMINVSSSRKDAFDDNDVRLLYTIANQMSNAIERLKSVITSEKNKMTTMVDGMTEGVIMIDEKGYIVVLNPSAKKILGFNVDHKVTTKQLQERFKELNIAQMLNGNFGGNNREIGKISKEIALGENIIHISAEQIHDDNKPTIGLVIVLRDITPQKKIEQAKLDFVSAVSHEIRNPLSMIKNAVSIIEMAGEPNENQKKFLSIAIRNIDRLARLVEQVLDISKMESGKSRFEMLSIKSLIDDSIEVLKIRANEKGIIIEEKVDEELPAVYGDRDKLEQVLINLLDNAIKFTEEGYITIEVKRANSVLRAPENRDFTGHNFEPKFAEISVSDTGIGISTDEQKKIFDKFQQVGASSQYKTTGFGLGLAITKELILSHHGKICVDSELGKGSTFTFTVPIDRESYEMILG